jgi:hypothetical protein
MYSRSFDEYEVDTPRGTTPKSYSRAVTPRQQPPGGVPKASPPLSAELVIETIGFQNLTCRQLAFLLHRMALQDPEMFTEGLRKPFGSTRVEVVIALYNQLCDIVNLPCLMKHLTIHERAVLIFRLGWLNLWSPVRPNGVYHLRFHHREERQLIRLLIATSCLQTETEWKTAKLSGVESASSLSSTGGGTDSQVGANFTPNETGSIIPSEWHKEDGLPARGVLSVEYQSGETESNLLKSNSPFLAFVLPTHSRQEEKLQKKRENVTTTHCQFLLHNAGLSLQL